MGTDKEKVDALSLLQLSKYKRKIDERQDIISRFNGQKLIQSNAVTSSRRQDVVQRVLGNFESRGFHRRSKHKGAGQTNFRGVGTKNL